MPQPQHPRPGAAAQDRAAHVVSLPLLPDGDVPSSPPEWVQLVPAGTFSGRDGRGPYRLDLAAVLAAFHSAGVDLPIDYDHQTLDADAKAGPVPAAGWIKELQPRAGGLWGRVQWTQRAAELIAAREYRYLSPVFRHDKAGVVLAIEGAGLTHYPNLDLAPVAHNQGADVNDLTPIAQALGVEGDADVAALAAHAARLRDAAARQPDPAQWVPMSQHKAVADELAALQQRIAAEKAEASVAAAMRAGKLAPALKDWALGYASRDADGFADWVEKAPVILEADQPAAHRVASNADTLTEEDRIACALLGLSEADFAAHKKTLGSAHA
ncbi:phage protease [Azohydromonas sediminis]|uniref:phage protease n=1 Tax=Azohydromonas sediminis TaxID=2259674 RepID=UPI000E64AB86|nr:phage protease [Azohydromonas sediminis]